MKSTILETARKGRTEDLKGFIIKMVAMKYKEGATNETLLPSPRPWPQNLDMISFSFNSLIIVTEALLGHLASEKDLTFFSALTSKTNN